MYVVECVQIDREGDGKLFVLCCGFKKFKWFFAVFELFSGAQSLQAGARGSGGNFF